MATRHHVAMPITRPFIQDISIRSVWTGNPNDAVNIEIAFVVTPSPGSSLPLIDLSSDLVKLVSEPEARPYSARRYLKATPEPKVSPRVNEKPRHCTRLRMLSPFPFSPPKGSHEELDREFEGALPILGSAPDDSPARGRTSKRDTVHRGPVPIHDVELARNRTPSVYHIPFRHTDTSEQTIDISLPSQPASLFDSDYDQHEIITPPLNKTAERLMVNKRITGNSLTNDFPSPRSKRFIIAKKVKEPTPLPERPPWRAAGAEAGTLHKKSTAGREHLGTRKTSQSADGRFHGSRTLGHRGKSASPGRTLKSVRSMDGFPNGTKKTSPGKSGSQSPSAKKFIRLPQTVRHDAKLNNAGSTVSAVPYELKPHREVSTPQWIEDARNDDDTMKKIEHVSNITDTDGRAWLRKLQDAPSLATSANKHNDQSGCPRVSGPKDGSIYCSSSLTRSQPETNDAETCLRGGVSSIGFEDDDPEISWLPNIEITKEVRLNFQENFTIGSDFVVDLSLMVRVIKDDLGHFVLRIPGLPLQADGGQGDFVLDLLEDSDSRNGMVSEMISWIRSDLEIQTFKNNRVSGEFSLGEAFSLRFLFFEHTRKLTSGQYEIDSVICQSQEKGTDHTVNAALCLLRPSKFIFWAENVEFDVCLSGGPTGPIVETFLVPGTRHIRLLSHRSFEAGNQLTIKVSCPVTEWDRVFVISWLAPFKPQGILPCICADDHVVKVSREDAILRQGDAKVLRCFDGRDLDAVYVDIGYKPLVSGKKRCSVDVGCNETLGSSNISPQCTFELLGLYGKPEHMEVSPTDQTGAGNIGRLRKRAREIFGNMESDISPGVDEVKLDAYHKDARSIQKAKAANQFNEEVDGWEHDPLALNPQLFESPALAMFRHVTRSVILLFKVIISPKLWVSLLGIWMFLGMIFPEDTVGWTKAGYVSVNDHVSRIVVDYSESWGDDPTGWRHIWEAIQNANRSPDHPGDSEAKQTPREPSILDIFGTSIGIEDRSKQVEVNTPINQDTDEGGKTAESIMPRPKDSLDASNIEIVEPTTLPKARSLRDKFDMLLGWPGRIDEE